MIWILNGKKKETIDKEQLTEKIASYSRVHIDVGCGDGKYPYTLARDNKEVFAIGIDASGDGMLDYSVKSRKKEAKGGAENLLYCISAVETLPIELWGIADEITVLLPWGSLLEGIVRGEKTILSNIHHLGKGTGVSFKSVFSYSTLHEGNEIEKRQLPDLSKDYISEILMPIYEEQGILIKAVEVVDDAYLKGLGTLWAKTLVRGKKREVYAISGEFL